MKLSFVNLSHPKIMAMHHAIANVFCCDIRSIHSISDTPQKMVAVFILSQFFAYKPKDIAGSYLISWCYVPTVVKKYTELYAVSENFQKKVMYILNFIELNYEEDEGRRVA